MYLKKNDIDLIDKDFLQGLENLEDKHPPKIEKTTVKRLRTVNSKVFEGLSFDKTPVKKGTRDV